MSDTIEALKFEVYTKDSILPLLPLVVWDAKTGLVVYATKAATAEVGVELLGCDVHSLNAELHESGLVQLNGITAGYAIIRKK